MSWNVFRKRLAYIFIPVLIISNVREVSGIGVAIVASGVLLRLWASGYLTKKVQLVMAGPYSFVRNPLYLGSLVIALGFAAAVRSIWLGAIILLFFALVYRKQVLHEENELARIYGDIYRDYSRQVPRILPRVAPYKAAPGAGFKMRNVILNREYNVALGAISLFILMDVYRVMIYPLLSGNMKSALAYFTGHAF